MLDKLTEVVRKADEHFERVGGSTCHWVRDCFLPELEAANLKVISTNWRDQRAKMEEAREWTEVRNIAGWWTCALRTCQYSRRTGSCGFYEDNDHECLESKCPLPEPFLL